MIKKKKLNIVFFSANRAEYSLIYPFLKIFLKHKMFNVELVVAGSHFSNKFGLSVEEIKKDNIKYYKINLPLNTNTLSSTSDYFNKLQNKVNLFLKKRNTDFVFLSSDRFETFAFAISTYLRKIPIIHYASEVGFFNLRSEIDQIFGFGFGRFGKFLSIRHRPNLAEFGRILDR